MAREIPEPVRAVAGLAMTVLDETRRLPQTIIGLPLRIFGLAMQVSLKLQQSYSGLVARGDEVFTGWLGEREPGLATFDEDEEQPPASPGARRSAFDRAGEDLRDDELVGLPQEPAPEEVVRALADLNQQVADAGLADAGPADAGRADGEAGGQETVTGDADALENALLEADRAGGDGGPAADAAAGSAGTAEDVGTLVDVPTAGGGVETVEAAVTDEGVATVQEPAGAGAGRSGGAAGEAAGNASGEAGGVAVATDEGGTAVAAGTGHRVDVDETDVSEEREAIAAGAAVDAVGEEADVPTDDAQGGSELSGAQVAGMAPVDGYDGFSIAQLRGRLRGYTQDTVQSLLDYEEATRAREPYLRMLRNRLERLQADAG